MTQRIGNVLVIAVEPPSRCEQCGAIDETRPYGPNGERICFDCGRRDVKTTERQLRKYCGFDDAQ